MFKKYLLCTALLLMIFSVKVFPSGIQVSNTTVTTNTDKKSAQVKFTLTWDHSWRLASTEAPANWDAAWVFVKFRTIPGDNWYHAYISTTMTTHKIPTNADMKVATSPAIIGGSNATPGVGAFIYRKAAGNGTITFQDIELNWTFTQNGLSGGEQVEVCVLATEMVNIPTGAYNLGDMTSQNSFRRQPAYYGGIAFPVTSASTPSAVSNSSYNSGTYTTVRNALQSSGVAAGGTADDFSGGTGDASTALSSAYPNGYNAFYCMKYEITQGEYLQFLNKNLVTVKNAKTYLPVPTNPVGRFAIAQRAGTGVGTVPAEFELTTANAAFLPCNWIGTKDILAWLVWAGLRPMTEFEFEKVCRGPEATPGTTTLRTQFAWGSVDINNTLGFSNKGSNNEGPSNAEANCAYAPSTTGSNTNMDGPMRSGGYATPVSSRTKAGASYFGVMEMSGNLRERCVTVGNANGRGYTGIHGNGEIGNGASPDLPTAWPSLTAAGLGFRGGSYLDIVDRARISDRQDINTYDAARKAHYGGRGVRTAP